MGFVGNHNSPNFFLITCQFITGDNFLGRILQKINCSAEEILTYVPTLKLLGKDPISPSADKENLARRWDLLMYVLNESDFDWGNMKIIKQKNYNQTTPEILPLGSSNLYLGKRRISLNHKLEVQNSPEEIFQPYSITRDKEPLYCQG